MVGYSLAPDSNRCENISQHAAVQTSTLLRDISPAALTLSYPAVEMDARGAANGFILFNQTISGTVFESGDLIILRMEFLVSSWPIKQVRAGLIPGRVQKVACSLVRVILKGMEQEIGEIGRRQIRPSLQYLALELR